jgi:hypothetical protein
MSVVEVAFCAYSRSKSVVVQGISKSSFDLDAATDIDQHARFASVRHGMLCCGAMRCVPWVHTGVFSRRIR